MNELKNRFESENQFLIKLFKIENQEIEAIFPNERITILSKFININYYKGINC
jgi:hypothetical protein